MLHKIYKITIGDYFYYGRTSQSLALRRYQHLNELKAGNKNSKFQRVWNKYGQGDLPELELQAMCAEEDVVAIEGLYIEAGMESPYCLNAFTYEDGLVKHSEQTKAKISETHKANYNGRLSGKGNPFYGKKHSEESKAKMSESKKGQGAGEKSPCYDHTKYTFEHKSGKVFVGTQHQFRHEFDLNQPNVSRLVLGWRTQNGKQVKVKSYKGWTVVRPNNQQ